jgi:hypothetical protein
MDDEAFAAACRVLGVSSDADRLAIDRAYAERKLLYAEDSLATYALLSEAERQEQLERLEAAHRRALEHLLGHPGPDRPTPEPTAPPAGADRAEARATDVAPSPPEAPKAPSPADRKPPPPFEPGESPGAYLRRCREGHGLDLARLAEETRISARHLSNLEADGFGELRAEVYIRGFVTTYARALKVTPVEPLVAAFLDLFRATPDA